MLPRPRQIEHLSKARANDVVLAVGQPLEKEDGCDEAVRSVRLPRLLSSTSGFVQLMPAFSKGHNAARSSAIT